ncbi:MAG TPA: DUF1476 domain-containing protein [Candidatus Sulfotelmatobacter sp.]|nr:DUF1476 domain-containing protein [Candidatus Sulfotelmatobacter sp.]
MTTFDEREHGFEAKFAHDQEMAFRARARRNKLLGRWTAEKIGLSGDANEVYAKGFATLNIENSDDVIVAKIMHALGERGVPAIETEIRQRMAQLGARAKAEQMKK